MIQKITTKSGSVYEIRGGRFTKNGKDMMSLYGNPFCISAEDLEKAENWVDIYASEHLPLQAGLCMYITGRDQWWLTTPIVSIEEEEYIP